MPLQPPGFPFEPPTSIAEVANLANQKPRKPPDPRYNEELKKKLVAQLWYYGVHNDKGDTYGSSPLPSLKKLAKDAIKAGKLVENHPRLQEYQQAVRQRDQTMRSLRTPAKRAEYDADLFIHFYFCTDGKPDPAKTPKPIVLKEFNGDWGQVARATHGVHGLEVSIARHNNLKYTICLGWDAAELRRLSKDIEAKAKAETEERERKEAIDSHKKLVAEANKIAHSETKPVRKNATPWEQLSRCVGSYFISCNALEPGYSMRPPCMNIQGSGPTKSILLADAYFGSIAGTMLLSFSEGDLDAYVAANDGKKFVNKNKRVDEGNEDDEDEDKSESSYNAALPKQSKKRKTPATTTKVGRPKKKAKISKASSSTPRRLHYRFKGRETGEGQIFYDPEKGYLDFNTTFTSFKGKANLPYVGTGVAMEGSKTDKKPRRTARPWSSFSEAAYEHERVARWR